MNILRRIFKSLLIRCNRLKAKILSQRYYKKTVFNYDDIISFFEGKSIAIIGGADSVFAEKRGAYIDSFDIVVRINKGIESDTKNSEYLGKRTDILFQGLDDLPHCCGKVEPMEWLKRGVKSVIFPYNGIVQLDSINRYVVRAKGKLPLYQVSEKKLDEIKNAIGSNPTTGFSAIYLLSRVNYKKIYITGFTFYKTPYRKGYNESKSYKQLLTSMKDHNPDMEYNVVKQIYENKKNIEVDKVLGAIFKTEAPSIEEIRSSLPEE